MMDSDTAADVFKKLTLADFDEYEKQVEGAYRCQTPQEAEFLAVGRLVTEKPIKFPFFKDTMASIWQPTMGMNAKEIQPRLYLFRFFHERDIIRIFEDDPWNYDQSLLILKRLKAHEDPEKVPLTHAEFWIQVHGLPTEFRAEEVLHAIGKFLGEFIKTDEKIFVGSLRVYYRIRVALNIAKPLRKGMRLKKNNGEWFSTEFRYERLPTFCFLCGLIGHGEKLCVKSLEGEAQQQERPFGPALRAGNRRNIPTTGEKWIAPESKADRKLWRTSGAGKSAESGSVKMANMQESGHDSAQASGKEKDTVLADMDLGQVGLYNLGQSRNTLLNKGKRPRVHDKDWSGAQEDCIANLEAESSIQNNLLEAGLARQARLEE
nr:uncharacterized protein LOC109189671 [Ipomoea batatas]